MAIALYVGAEVSIGTMLILYLPDALGVSAPVAGAMVANLYWGGALVGRFLGSVVLRFVAGAAMLAVAGGVAATLCGGSLALSGTASAWCLLAIGLFNSIMFPTIFALALERSSAPAAATSGLLCLAIGPGAVLPVLTGGVADLFGIGWAFAAPMIAYLWIACFALAAVRAAGRGAELQLRSS